MSGRTLHQADLPDGRTRRALLGIQVNLFERDNLLRRPGTTLMIPTCRSRRCRVDERGEMGEEQQGQRVSNRASPYDSSQDGGRRTGQRIATHLVHRRIGPFP